MSNKLHDSKLKLAREFRVATEDNLGVILEFLSLLDCPRALTVALLFENGEHEQLANLSFDPLNYLTVKELQDAYVATKFLSKYRDLSLPYDLDKVAMDKFEKFELICGVTNRRFRNLALDPLYRGPTVLLHNAVVRKIAEILGDFSYDEFFEDADWGPGATTRIKSLDASSANKFQREVGITRDLYALLHPMPGFSFLEKFYPLWAKNLGENGFPVFEVGNRVVTVPKDATQNRVIAIEPGINLWFQKAIGSMIGKRLGRHGIDLHHQYVNQRFAKQGSKDLINATVDFSSASDSISLEVVRELLPPDWFQLLDCCRSHFGIQEGKPTKWNKFSSMGNGFTFQLESLIFYAISICCKTVTSPLVGNVSVYGDDVIVPVKSLELFAELSSFYGFTLNRKKSHYSSCFRESCGAHFYSGVDVKPIYLKDKLSDVRTVYRLANAVRRLAHLQMNTFGCDSRFRPLFDRLVKLVPRPLRVMIPESLGDGGFIANFDEASPSRARHGVEGYLVLNLLERSKTSQSEEVGLLLAKLWDAPTNIPEFFGDVEYRVSQRLNAFNQGDLLPDTGGSGNSVPIRGRVRLKFKRSLTKQWYDLGMWL